MLLSSLLTFFFMGSAVSTGAVACNGNAALCSRLYSNVSLIGTHDSAFVGILPTDNQDVSVATQLDDGIRFLQAQTHYFLDELSMCHTSCYELYAGTLTSYLSSIKTWIDDNPNQVVTLLLTNGDFVDVSLFGTAFSSVGLDTYAYTPSEQLTMSEWPTLQQLIHAGTPLVVFLDYDADTTTVPYILPEFNYFFETAYDVTDPTFSSCALNRPPGSNGDGLMMMVNHFLDESIFGILIPDDGADSTTNAATGTGSVGAQAALCEQTWERKPNLILVDYFDKGNVFTAQNTLNGL